MATRSKMAKEKGIRSVSPRLRAPHERQLLHYKEVQAPSILEHDHYEVGPFEEVSYPMNWPVRKDSLTHALENARQYTLLKPAGGQATGRTHNSDSADNRLYGAVFTPRDYQIDPPTGLISLFGSDYLNDRARPYCYKIEKMSDRNKRQGLESGDDSQESVRALLRQSLKLLQRRALEASRLQVVKPEQAAPLKISQPFHPRTISAIAPIPGHVSIYDLVDRRNERFFAALSRTPVVPVSPRPVKTTIHVSTKVADRIAGALSDSSAASRSVAQASQSSLNPDEIQPASPISKYGTGSSRRNVQYRDRSVRQMPRRRKPLPPARVAPPLSINTQNIRPRSPEPGSPLFEPPTTPPPTIPLPDIPTKTHTNLRGGNLFRPNSMLMSAIWHSRNERQTRPSEDADPVLEANNGPTGERQVSNDKVGKPYHQLRPESSTLKRHTGHARLSKHNPNSDSREPLNSKDSRKRKTRSQPLGLFDSESSRIDPVRRSFGDEIADALSGTKFSLITSKKKRAPSPQKYRTASREAHEISDEAGDDAELDSHIDIKSQPEASAEVSNPKQLGTQLDYHPGDTEARRLKGRQSENMGRYRSLSAVTSEKGVQRRVTVPFISQGHEESLSLSSPALSTRMTGDIDNNDEIQTSTEPLENPSIVDPSHPRANPFSATKNPKSPNNNRPYNSPTPFQNPQSQIGTQRNRRSRSGTQSLSHCLQRIPPLLIPTPVPTPTMRPSSTVPPEFVIMDAMSTNRL